MALLNARFRYFIPVAAGILGALLLSALYFGIVSWAESFQHAADLFWEDRWLVIPIIMGFGIQTALYSILKLGLYMPVPGPGQAAVKMLTRAPGIGVGAGGTTSTVAMIACCAHHAVDVLPILGLTAAATFLAEYQTAFMVAGLLANLAGITAILIILFRTRRMASHRFIALMQIQEEA